MGYIKHSLKYCMVGWVGDQQNNLSPHFYADADLAGCERTQRSTSGGHLAIEGESSKFPLVGKSSRQTCTSSSTPEAELVAGHNGYKNILMPALDLWEVLLPKGTQGVFHEDNTAMIRVVQTGRNPSMKHLHRVHGISIGFLHERLTLPETKDPVDLVYEESANMAADVYTKAFTSVEKWGNARRLINVFAPDDLSQIFDVVHVKTPIVPQPFSTNESDDEHLFVAGTAVAACAVMSIPRLSLTEVNARANLERGVITPSPLPPIFPPEPTDPWHIPGPPSEPPPVPYPTWDDVVPARPTVPMGQCRVCFF